MNHRLKLIFPQDIDDLRDVKLLHPKIKKVLTGAHISPKLTSNRIFFVEFKNKADSESAYNSLKRRPVAGGRLLVHNVKSPKKNTAKPMSARSIPVQRGTFGLIKLYIANPPENVTTEDIKAAIPNCKNVKIFDNHGYASFMLNSSKTALLCQLRPPTVCGQPVQIISKLPGRHSPKRKPGASRMDTSDPEPDDAEMNELEDMDVAGNSEENMFSGSPSKGKKTRKPKEGHHKDKIPVKTLTKQKSPKTSKRGKFQNITLFITNPPTNVTNEDILHAFPHCKNVTLLEDGRVSFSVYSSKTALMYQLKPATVCGQPVTVASKPRDAEMMRPEHDDEDVRLLEDVEAIANLEQCF